MDFSGKVVIVTGSSSGIGAAAAKLFANHGASLTVIGRNETRLKQVTQTCSSAKGNPALSLRIDLTQPNACEEVVSKTIETFGKIDVLVNCAGKLLVSSLFDNQAENFDDLVSLNLKMPYKMTQLCIPHLTVTKGSIVNVFAAPMKPDSFFLVCSMIRDAMERFTKSGAIELASVGVRMNAVRPGITRTNMLNNFNVDNENVNQTYDFLADMVPGGAIIEPEEIARMILFAASDVCPNMSGANLFVDGAMSNS